MALDNGSYILEKTVTGVWRASGVPLGTVVTEEESKGKGHVGKLRTLGHSKMLTIIADFVDGVEGYPAQWR